MTTDTTTVTRTELHALVDTLPEGELGEARRYLKGLSTTDPLERALLLAPLEDEGLSEAEVVALETAERRYRGGSTQYVTDEQLARELRE